MKIEHRNLFFVFVMQVITFGIYSIYWTFKTKDEIKSLGAEIPSAILSIIPIVNMYFWYKYLVGYIRYVKKESQNTGLVVVCLFIFFIFFPLPTIGMLIIQNGLNKVAITGVQR